tara:strand:- start:67 stop:444 length:378 start_codon:yes stop_codon:yes gene_type:complete
MPTLETIGFIPQVAPLVILLLLSFVLNVKLFLPTVGQIFAVRKQSSYAISNLLNQPETTQTSSTSSLSTSIFSSPGSLGNKDFGSSLHSVLQTQFSNKVNTSLLKDLEASEESKKLQTLISYKVK